jgi:hypothetical protein
MLALLFVGCDGVYFGRTATPSFEKAKTSTPPPFPTTEILTTENPDSSSLLQTSPISKVQQWCLHPENLPPVIETEPNSVFVVSAYNENQYYFWDFENKEATPVSFSQIGYKAFGGRISPNRHWISFEVNRIDDNENVIERKLEILDALGQHKTAMSWEKNWGVLREWLNNDTLYIEGYGTPSGTIFSIEPFVGTTKELIPTFTNIYNDYPPAIWSNAPNSELTLMLYPNSASTEGGIGYTLWDMVAMKKIWHKDSRTAPSVPPQWSSDYKKFAVNIATDPIQDQSEIFVFDNSGQMISQTDFGAKYSSVFFSRYMSWSPDGRYIATWISLGTKDNQPEHPSLVLVDLNEGIAINYCLQSFGIGSDIIWSNEGKWLITRPDDIGSNVLIDISENKAYLIPLPNDGTIYGWMIKP